MKTKTSCHHLAYAEPARKKDKLVYYLVHLRGGVKTCEFCGCVLRMSWAQLFLLFIVWFCSGIIYLFVLRRVQSLAIELLLTMILIALQVFWYLFVRTVLPWHETRWQERTVPRYIIVIYNLMPTSVMLISILFQYGFACLIE